MSWLLEDIQIAVCQWHNRHPLAERLDAHAVHSVGWVALPFMRSAQAVEPTLDAAPDSRSGPVPFEPGLGGWIKRLRRPVGAGPWPVFSEVFIEGLRPGRVAAFARHAAWEAPEPASSDWPQRRIEVDSGRAEACQGAWPVEQWLLSAAVEWRGRKLRVLLGERRGQLRVLGAQRHWALARLVPAVLIGATALAGLVYAAWPEADVPGPAAPAPRASSALAASAPHAASRVMAASAPASEPASAPASAPLAASAPASAASAPGSAPASSASGADAMPPDIRPRLGPVYRDDRRPRATREALQAAIRAPGAPTPSSSSAAAPASGPYRGARDPEQLRIQEATSGPQVALVGPPLPSRAEAEALLARMKEHVAATVRDASSLQSELFQTPQGWRAAVWPFGSREEAQIINATMVARGWKTRALDF